MGSPVTQASIVSTAERLIRRHGRSKVTVSGIARELGVTHAALYRYFKGKREIENAVLQIWIAESIARIEKAVEEESDPAKRIERILVEMHLNKKQKIAEDPEVFEIYINAMNDIPDVVAKYRSVILKAVFAALTELTGDMSRAMEAGEALENAVFRFLHPLHTKEQLGQDTERPMRNVIRALITAYSKSP